MLIPDPVLDRDLAAIFSPPEVPPTHCEYAATLQYPDGPSAGDPLDPTSEPMQEAMLRAMDGEWKDIQGLPFRDFTHLTCVQVGKSLIDIIVPSMRAVAGLKINCVYCLPTLDLLDKVWTTKLAPAIRGCGLGAWMPVVGSGSKGGRPKALQFIDPRTGSRAGNLIFIAGGQGTKREVGQAGVTAGVVLIDEADEYEDSHRVELVKQRAASYGKNAIIIQASTIKKDVNSVILAMLEESTFSRLWYPCPHCSKYQTLEWENVRYEGDDDIAAAESSRYFCPHCGAGWTDDERKRALGGWRLAHRGQSVRDDGTVDGPMPRTRAFGLWGSKLDYRLGHGLAELAAEHRRAAARVEVNGDHGLMRSFYRDRLAKPYLGDQTSEDSPPDRITRAYMAARSASSFYDERPYEREEDGDGIHISNCPAEVEALIVTVDVQRGGTKAPGRLYFLIMGVDSDFRTYDLSWGSSALAPIGCQPSTGQLHAGLDKMHALANSISADYNRGIVYRGVDVGDRQDEIRQWLIRHSREWLAIKGQAYGNLPAVDYWDLAGWIVRRRQDGGWNLHFVDVNEVRQQAQLGFRVPQMAPGAAHIPRGLTAQSFLIRHYCATALIPDGKGGAKWAEKDKDRQAHPDLYRRQDWLDCRTYALALAYKWVRDLNKPRRHVKYGVVGTVKGPET